MPGLRKNGSSWRSGLSWGGQCRNWAGPIVLSLPWHPSVFRDKNVPFLLVQERHLSHEGFLNCQGGIRESSDWPAIFSNTFHLKYSLCQNVNGAWRRAWQPTQYSCQKNFMDRGAWWALVHGVTKSRTQLKWLSTRAHTSRCEWGSLSWALSPSRETVPMLKAPLPQK